MLTAPPQAVFFLLVAMTLFSGASLFQTRVGGEAHRSPSGPPPPAYPSQPAGHPAGQPPPPQIYWAAIPPAPTPHRLHSRQLAHDDTPDTDNSPSDMKTAIVAPSTPGRRRSPSKGDGRRSPAKSRSPHKRF